MDRNITSTTTSKKNNETKEKGKMFFAGIETNTKRFKAQSQIIKELANKGSCIIIGRCANYILKDNPNKISIFIHAPLDSRIERRKGITIVNAENQIKKEDKARGNYYNYYTGQNWQDIKEYDLTIDTSKTGLNGAVEIIENYIKIVQKNNTKNIIK